MVTLHFESEDRELINRQNYEWASLFEGSEAYKENQILVTSIRFEDVEDDDESFRVWVFDVVFDRPVGLELQSVNNGYEILEFS